MTINQTLRALLVCLCVIIPGTSIQCEAQTDSSMPAPQTGDFTSVQQGDVPNSNITLSLKKIRDLYIQGNEHVPTEAVRAKIPYRSGQIFKSSRSSEMIRGLYAMGYFKPTVQLVIDDVSDEEIDLYVILEEKDVVDEIIFEGNSNLKREEIEKKISLSELRGVDINDLKRISFQLSELYKSKDFHDAIISEELVPTSEGHVNAVFHINEQSKSHVREVRFVGNKCIATKKLSKLTMTKPAWLFGFLTKAGTYQPDMIEYDKYVLEHYYKSHGFLHAKVENVSVVRAPDNDCAYIVTFFIKEGDIYTVRNVCALGNELFTDEQVLERIMIEPGELYSSEKIRMNLEHLRLVWGEYGYIFAESNPIIEPDESTKMVDITFTSTLGEPVTANRIGISGHAKTREHVIRREITFNEGELVTSRGMDDSRERVERLGFFDPQSGVNWKTTRINESEADLELILKEIKTGKAYADFKFGGEGEDIQSPARSFQFGLGAQNLNFQGTGIRYNASAYFSLQDRQIALNIVNPWLFNRPLQGGVDVYHRTSTYSDFKNVREAPREQLTGGAGSLGFTTPWCGGASCLFDLGFESISYKNKIEARVPFEQQERQAGFQALVSRLFQPGQLLWTGAQIIQDFRNNPVTPSRGYLWSSVFKVGIPYKNKISEITGQQEAFGFVKWDADAHWYTPLINEYSLIFHMHGHVGLVNEIGNHVIPYRELYHIGGPSSVRGFLFGQIGPTLLGDSIGAKKAIWMNAELIFPLTKDFNIVGLVFYDGGAGWDTPGAQLFNAEDSSLRGLLRNNQFNFRQAIGVGVKLRSPTPISIAVGLKLDRNKRLGESVSEVHFTSAVDF